MQSPGGVRIWDRDRSARRRPVPVPRPPRRYRKHAMADTTRIGGAGLGRVRISLRSAFLLVGAIAAAALLLRVLSSSQRVIGWMLVAAAIAGLLHSLVVRLDRHMPRGVAVLIVMGGLLVSGGLAVYAL